MSADRGIIDAPMHQWDVKASQEELRRDLAKQGRKVIEVHRVPTRPVYLVVTTEDDASSPPLASVRFASGQLQARPQTRAMAEAFSRSCP